MRKNGWKAQIVEIRHGIFRNDLFTVADVLAFKCDQGILLVQAYLKGKEKDHQHLNIDNEIIRLWVQCGGKFEHHIWRQTNERHRGKRKTWKVERVNLLF